MTRRLWADEQILITPIFDAPREHVFKAWTDQDELAARYGPERLDTPREKIHIDLRVGGRWELTMVQRDGVREMPIGYEILELVEPELLVLRSDPMPQAGLATHLAGQGPPGGCTGAREPALMQRVTVLIAMRAALRERIVSAPAPVRCSRTRAAGTRIARRKARLACPAPETW